jgi:hypothetical protein
MKLAGIGNESILFVNEFPTSTIIQAIIVPPKNQNVALDSGEWRVISSWCGTYGFSR